MTARLWALLNGNIPRVRRLAERTTMKKPLSAVTSNTFSRRRQRRPISVLIVDDKTLVPLAISKWVNRFPDLKVCGHAKGERAAFEQVRKLKPSLVLTEILLPRGISFIRDLHRRFPRLPILVFTHLDEEAYALSALAAGARGYLKKGVDGDTLVAGIRNALKGYLLLGHAMAMHLTRRKDIRQTMIRVLPMCFEH